jgi:hypothetical protein
MTIALDLMTGPYETDRLPGTGAAVCECGNHRSRCTFGRSHVWTTAYYQGRLIATADTYSCHVCGAICIEETAE